MKILNFEYLRDWKGVRDYVQYSSLNVECIHFDNHFPSHIYAIFYPT